MGFTVSAASDAASWIALVRLCLAPADASLPVLAVPYTAPVAIGGLGAGLELDCLDRRLVTVVDSLVRVATFASIPVVVIFAALT